MTQSTGGARSALYHCVTVCDALVRLCQPVTVEWAGHRAGCLWIEHATRLLRCQELGQLGKQHVPEGGEVAELVSVGVQLGEDLLVRQLARWLARDRVRIPLRWVDGPWLAPMDTLWTPPLIGKQKALAVPRSRVSQAPVSTEGYVDGAEAGTRTPTPEGTAPSRQRVYQFHHFRTMLSGASYCGSADAGSCAAAPSAGRGSYGAGAETGAPPLASRRRSLAVVGRPSSSS